MAVHASLRILVNLFCSYVCIYELVFKLSNQRFARFFHQLRYFGTCHLLVVVIFKALLATLQHQRVICTARLLRLSRWGQHTRIGCQVKRHRFPPAVRWLSRWYCLCFVLNACFYYFRQRKMIFIIVKRLTISSVIDGWQRCVVFYFVNFPFFRWSAIIVTWFT